MDITGASGGTRVLLVVCSSLLVAALVTIACSPSATSTPVQPTNTLTPAAPPSPTPTSTLQPAPAATATLAPSPTVPTAAVTPAPPTATSPPPAPATDTPTAPTAPSEVAADIANFALPDLTIHAGTTVTWTNQDGFPHTATSGDSGSPDGVWDSAPLSSGESFSFTFEQPGEFPYFCQIHSTMRGTMTVQ